MDNSSSTKSRGQFRTLAEAIPQIVWTADADGRAAYFNTRWVEYTGLDPDVARADGWLAFVHPDDADRIAAAWRAAVAGPADRFRHELRLRRSDGAYRWFLSAAVPLLRDDGSVEQWMARADKGGKGLAR